jgi:hypothetical protein
MISTCRQYLPEVSEAIAATSAFVGTYEYRHVNPCVVMSAINFALSTARKFPCH